MKSKKRSRSASAPRAATNRFGTGPLEGCTFEVVAGVTKSDGEKTHRAEVSIPRPSANDRPEFKSGGTITLRGPSRVGEGEAKKDGEDMLEALTTKGMDAGRALQRTLVNSRIKHDDTKAKSRSPSRKARRSPSRKARKSRSPSRKARKSRSRSRKARKSRSPSRKARKSRSRS